MAKLDIQPIKNYWQDDLDIQPLDIQPIKEEPSLGRKVVSGLKQSFAGLGNTMDTAGAMLSQGIGQLVGAAPDEKIFEELQKRKQLRNEWAQDVDPGFVGKAAGMIGTLPAQVLAMPFSAPETMTTFIDKGEPLPRALAAGAVDSIGNVVGMMVPGSAGVSRTARALSGGVINAAQDTATKLALSNIAQGQEAKDVFAPSFESAALAAIPGAGFGALTKGKPQIQKPLGPDADSVLRTDNTTTEGVLGKERAGEIDWDYYKQRQAEAESLKLQEQEAAIKQQQLESLKAAERQVLDEQRRAQLQEIIARVEEQQRMDKLQVEAEKYVAENEPSQVGLSTGEGKPSVADPKRPRYVAPPQQPAPRMDPALALGETSPSVKDPIRKTLPEKLPNDPFGSLIGNQRISKFKQGGGIDPDLLTFGLGKLLKGWYTGNKTPDVDSLDTPHSSETIAVKQDKANKAQAVGIKNSVYSDITTLDQVKALPGKDLNAFTTQQLGAGVEGALRRNTQNKLLQYVSTLRTKAEANTNYFLRKYVTGKDGFNITYKDLSDTDIVRAHEVALALNKNGVDFTPEVGAKLQLPKNIADFLASRQRMTDGEYELGEKVNKELGLSHFKRRGGVARANFDNAYLSIVGKWEGEGSNKRFKPYTVLNASTLWEYRKALEWWNKEKAAKGLNDYEVREINKGKGLNTNTDKAYARPMDGLAKLMSELAEINPDFKDAKTAVEEYIKGSTKKLGKYDVHTLTQTGVGGAIGRKPWQDTLTNAKQFFKGEVESFDQGFRYWNYQGVLNGIAKAIADPEIASKYENTIPYLKQYKGNLDGSGLNEFGSLANAVVNAAMTPIGARNSSTPRKFMSEARKAASFLMMGVHAPTFAAVQLTQYWTGGIPEALRIAKDMDISAVKATADSFSKFFVTRPYLWLADATGKLDQMKFIDPTIRDAYKWMKEHGISDYNEVVQSHEAANNPKLQKIEDVLGAPMTLPEMVTRPTVFLWYVDLMKEKLKGEELYTAAKRATDYAMTNYHRDEAPLIYNRSGVLGENIGGLKKFVHNAVDQQLARGMELTKYPAAFAATMGFTIALQGLTGVMGYQMADQMSQLFTDKPLRHWLEQMTSNKNILDGVLSAQTGYDFQTRYSLAQIVPNNLGETIAGPHIMKLADILSAGYTYAKDQDAKSFNELIRAAAPSGMGGYVEDALYMEDGYVLDKEGQHKYEQPRTPKEQWVRKHTGIRPLRERLEDENLYATKKLEAKLNDKQKDAYSRMKANVNFDDPEGFDKAYADYQEYGGDPKVIEKLLKQNAEKRNLSARQRASMTPGKSVSTIKKYERYWED